MDAPKQMACNNAIMPNNVSSNANIKTEIISVAVAAVVRNLKNLLFVKFFLYSFSSSLIC